MARDRPHIFVREFPAPEPYRPHGFDPTRPTVPSPKNPKAHAAALKASLDAAKDEAEQRRADAGITVAGAAAGIYVEFESVEHVELRLESLDLQGSGIEVVAVTKRGNVERAIVFVPDGKLKQFHKRFDEYATKKTKSGARKNKDLVERIAALRLATLRALWTDDANLFPPSSTPIWWEVWLRITDGREEERLRTFAEATVSQASDRVEPVRVGGNRLTFPDRIVLLVHGTPEQMSASIDILSDVAEVRRAKEVPSTFVKYEPIEQADWVEDLRRRLDPTGNDDAPVVCVLDTGVNYGHPLLSASLAASDAHTVDPGWNRTDHDGHGTEMAGLALFGDLSSVLQSSARVALSHRLESVKILPPRGANPPELYGSITAQAVARVEVQAPERRRAFSLSITAKDHRDRGQASSWSAALDALACGRSFDVSDKGLEYLDDDADNPRRLFVVSAGNVDDTAVDYLARSDAEAVHDPAQAWNALTIGACTSLATLDPTDPDLEGLSPLARVGDLSPYSTTSLTFAKGWPIKPDVVFEGGNKVHDGRASLQCDALSLVTTYYKPQEKLLVSTCATSAATAQVARFTGALAATYPNMWAETKRALIVHSAEWTPRMLERYTAPRSPKKFQQVVLRRFGFGVPNLDAAVRSASNALTLVVQDTIRPFNDGRLREMKVYELPWPRDVLEDLGELDVRMRVTLSYFIEPNPGRRGWRNRYRYASHGLRFAVALPTESVRELKKRVNKLALEEDETRPGGSDPNWVLGWQYRNRGSLHADLWKGTAADLARRGNIAVYPVSGWWKDQPKRDRSQHGARFALIVSIETQDERVDVYTPVAMMVGVPVHTEIESSG